MDKARLNAVAGWAPVALSVIALTIIIVALVTGWEHGLKDEGSVAHLFQLALGLQVPLVALFLATANWRSRGRIFGMDVTQGAAAAAACAPVAILGL